MSFTSDAHSTNSFVYDANFSIFVSSSIHSHRYSFSNRYISNNLKRYARELFVPQFFKRSKIDLQNSTSIYSPNSFWRVIASILMILYIIHRILRMLLLVYSMVSPLVILLAYWHSIIRQMNASITTFLLFDIHMQLWMNSLVFPCFSLMMTSTMVSRRLVCFLWSRYFYYQQYSSCISFHYLYYCRTVIWILLAYSKISISTSCIYPFLLLSYLCSLIDPVQHAIPWG